MTQNSFNSRTEIRAGGQTVQLEFEYLPDDKKITYHTLNNALVDTQADYQLGDEGSSTLIDCHQTTHLLQSLPVPDGFIKQSIRSLFVGQLADHLQDAAGGGQE